MIVELLQNKAVYGTSTIIRISNVAKSPPFFVATRNNKFIVKVICTKTQYFQQVVDNQVVMIRTKENEGYYGLQIGAIDQPKLKNVSLNKHCLFMRGYIHQGGFT